jgi:arabinosyltransferase C
VLAALTIVLAVALPLAPVSVDTPEVQWPLDPADPQPTTALFMPYRPIDITAAAPCATIRELAGRQADGASAVLLATALPDRTRGNERALSITVGRDAVRVVSSGAELWEGPVPAGEDCSLVVRADQDGTRATLEDPGDGTEVLADRPGAKVPEVTAFTTDVTAADGSSPTVVAHPDARFQTSPTAVKLVLVALHVLAVLACLWLLWRASPKVTRGRDRAVAVDGTEGPPLAYERVSWGRAMALLADVGVVVTLVAWTAIGFLNTDDYYYSLEARTLDSAGFVGNQFRFFNVPEVPFVLLQTLLAPLTELSTQPVVLRLPSLLAGLLVWWLLTRQLIPLLVDRPHPALRVVAAVALLAWWLPWNIGTRPEFLVTLAWAVTATLALQAIRQQRAWLIGLAAAVAGTAVTITASGLACVATLAILLPRMWPTLRRSALGAWGSLALVVACASLPAAVVFSDATLATAVTALRVHQEVGPAESWDKEVMRYWYLTLGPDENMRTFAKQLIVVLTIVVVVAVSISLLRMTRPRGGRTSWLVPAIGFLITVVALVPSPTKWTHHFGALAAPGALALTVAVALLVRRRPDRWASLGIMGVVAFTAALAFHAGNRQVESSAYGVTPVLPDVLGNPVLWLGTGLLFAAAAWYVRRRIGSTGRQAWPEAAVGTLAAALVVSVAVQTASASLATWRYWDTFSLAGNAASALTGGEDCGFADHAVALTDPVELRALPAADADAEGSPDADFPGVGGSVGDLAPAGVRRWSTWTDEPTTGPTTITTPWLEIGDLTERDVLALSVTGSLNSGTEVSVEFGAAGAGAEPAVLDTVEVDFEDDEEDYEGSWEQERLGSTTHLAAGATLVRVQAVDRNFTGGGWLGVTDPYRVDGTTLLELFEGEDVVLDWPVGFALPCVDPPRIADGMVPPVEWIMLSEKYADAPELLVIDERGGSYATMTEVADATTYPGFSPGVGPEYTEWGRLVRYDRELPADAYRLVEDERVIAGWGWWPGAGEGPVPDGDKPDS